jgi:hypothetical protein
MLQRPFAFAGFAVVAVLAMTIAGCGASSAGSAAASPGSSAGAPTWKRSLLPMRLDVSGNVVGNKGARAGYHQYWRYDAVPTACDKADGASNTYDVRTAAFTVGARSERFANLYFVRCRSAIHTWQGGVVAAHMLPLRLEITGDLASAGALTPFDRHLKVAATPVACDVPDKPLPEPVTAVPGEHLKGATIALAVDGQTQVFHSPNVYFIRCSKEK